MLPVAIAPLSQCGADASVFRDPIVNFAYGGRADFRGKHNALYNFLSAPGLSVNVKTEEAVFFAHHGVLTVNGTFLTEAHVTAQLSPQKRATASFWASELDPNNFGWRVVNRQWDLRRPRIPLWQPRQEGLLRSQDGDGLLERHL